MVGSRFINWEGWADVNKIREMEPFESLLDRGSEIDKQIVILRRMRRKNRT